MSSYPTGLFYLYVISGLQSYLCVLTLIRCPFHPMLPQWHVKDPSDSARTAGGRLHLKHACSLDPTKSEWADVSRCPGVVWEPIRKGAHAQLVRKHSAIVVMAR